MSDLSHLRLENTADSLAYTYAGGVQGGHFALPPRDRRPHADKLKAEIEAARDQIDAVRVQPPENKEIDGYQLTLRSDPDFELKLESVERLKQGMELLSVQKEDKVTVATVFIQRDKLVNFLRLIEHYSTQETKTGKPKNQSLIKSIASIRRLVLKDLWQDDDALFPDPGRSIWWEVWLRTGQASAPSVYPHFKAVANSLKIYSQPQYVKFPERVVLLACGTPDQLGQSPDLLAYIAELRKAKELPTEYLNLAPRDQQAFVADAAARVVAPGQNAPAVCLLDTGVNRAHPLLAPILAPADTQAVDPQWGTSDHHPNQHGTGMAGIAAFGCLVAVFNSSGPLHPRHRLESVKLLPPPPGANAPEVYGWVTQQAVAKAEIQAPQRNRAICMAVTADDRDQGLPSSWSAAVDQMCAGELDEHSKLMFISAGNYDEVVSNAAYLYPDSNFKFGGIQDPAQSWNAVTVGAYTERIVITDPEFLGWQPIAPAGDLSPSSRTSLPWPSDNHKGWPIKPDIVMEGGNYVTKGTNCGQCADHMLLTTTLGATGQLLSTLADTSAATAGAARLAAILWSHYPSLRPETLRALLIHSAQWTDAMQSRFPGTSKAEVQRRLRCYGYGVPNIHRAIYSAENAATLIYEGQLQPFGKEDGVIKTREMHLHQLPWPTEVLQQLGEVEVTIRVTLSYFVEPSPGRKGWEKRHRFQSHGLRFDVIHPVETPEEFRKRISRASWDEDEGRPENVRDDRKWMIGPKGRTHGSIHSDWWTGTASELAQCNQVAVYPVTGWWRERPHLQRWDRKARYSLVISIETSAVEVDLYTPIASQTAVSTELIT